MSGYSEYSTGSGIAPPSRALVATAGADGPGSDAADSRPDVRQRVRQAPRRPKERSEHAGGSRAGGPSACRLSVLSTLVVLSTVTVLSTRWSGWALCWHSPRHVCSGGRASCRAVQAVYSMMAAAQGFSSEERSEFVPGSVFGAHSPPEPFPSQPGADANAAAPAEGADASTASANAPAAADGESQPADLSEWTVIVACCMLHAAVCRCRVYGVHGIVSHLDVSSEWTGHARQSLNWRR